MAADQLCPTTIVDVDGEMFRLVPTAKALLVFYLAMKMSTEFAYSPELNKLIDAVFQDGQRHAEAALVELCARASGYAQAAAHQAEAEDRPDDARAAWGDVLDLARAAGVRMGP
jgi:hypothetical protein